METNKRRKGRMKAVLPVRVRGTDNSGKVFDELAHTLDVTVAGVRLGAVRREFSALDQVTVFYRQRKMEFRVVWTRKLEQTTEYQVGLQNMTQAGEVWGLSPADFEVRGTPRSALLAARSQKSVAA
jgi:hypothetical protein